VNQQNEIHEKINELNSQIDHLQNLFSIYQQNINNNITWFIALLTLSVAIAGGGLLIWARFLVQREFKKEYEKIDNRILKLIKENQQILYARGAVLVQNGRIEILGFQNFSADKIILFQVFSPDGKLLINNTYRNYFVDRNGKITVEFNNQDYDNQMVHWYIIWARDQYTNNQAG
jgi:hypothetical protein